ncbi:MAG: hypothetical protein C4530_12460 [Desulfobacteraceae bacterium]|nr:MAG: hypothetical protein C4530_12460 [Desulfobacteraceae bacterium]
MRALVKYEKSEGKVGIRNVPEPTPGTGEVQVQLKAAGLCYSDIAIIHNRYIGRKPVPIPLVLGHEGAGIVSAVGEGVKNLSPGDHVGIAPLRGCGACRDCRSGNENMCLDWHHIGITCNGTFAEYVCVSANKAHRIPEDISFIDAACLEPIGLTVRTLETVRPLVGDTVAVIGPGSLGFFHLQAFKASGAGKIIVIGRGHHHERFQMAAELGADHGIYGTAEDIARQVLEITDGKGADIVVETANTPEAASLAIEVAGNRGRIALFGLYPEAKISPLKILRKGITLFGDVSQLDRHFIRAIKWVEAGMVSAAPLVKRKYKLEEYPEALASIGNKDMLKVLFEI